MITQALALLAYGIGFVLIALSMTETNARFASEFVLLAIAAWIFGAGCGIWHLAYLVEKRQKPK